MPISRIAASNFKTFREIDVCLDDLNVVIGANANGKSNFLQIFRFLRDLAVHGLENAISLQGDVTHLRNLKLGASRNLRVEAVYRHDEPGAPLNPRCAALRRALKKTEPVLTVLETRCRFELSFDNSHQDPRIARDELTWTFRLGGGEDEGLEGSFCVAASGGAIETRPDLPERLKGCEDDLFLQLFALPRESAEAALAPGVPLISSPVLFLPAHARRKNIRDYLANMAIFDFEAKAPRKAVSVAGKAELEENGENLALTLRKILSDPERARKFKNLIQDLLPYVTDVGAEILADRSIILRMREQFFGEEFLPASLLSDGSIILTAMTVALYFDARPFVVFEEPEANVHPHLISKLMDMLKDASRCKQTIVTTHNPEMVKYAGLERLLLAARDEEGFSSITRPAEKEEALAFLENEMGVEELYVQNLLSF